ncbi:hypothetical protein EJB05_00631, partial [Eragrostis curvula]
GILSNGEMVAVKKLHSFPGIDDKQFEKEARALTFKHENIVRFLGSCNETRLATIKHEGKDLAVHEKEMLLCLEYMTKGSLESRIEDASRGLNWDKGYKIIKGICRGLHFLHEESQISPIIHGDLKPANILLTNEMVPKITDFGLSRLLGEEASRIYTKKRVTKKLDIFSLGAIVLEMITGEKNYPWSNGAERPEDYVENFDRRFKKWRKRLQQSNPASLEKDCKQIKQCIEIGLKCVKTEEKERPTIEEIIESLNNLDSMNGESSRRNVPVNNIPLNSSPGQNPPPQSNQSNGQRTSKWVCAGCKSPIVNEGKLMAMGSDWHYRCFKCSACNNPIHHNSRFFPKDNQPYHEACYNQRFTPRCSACNNLIPPNTRYFEKEGQKYHEACYKERFNLKCAKCHNFLPSDGNGRMEWNVGPSGEKKSFRNCGRTPPKIHPESCHLSVPYVDLGSLAKGQESSVDVFPNGSGVGKVITEVPLFCPSIVVAQPIQQWGRFKAMDFYKKLL